MAQEKEWESEYQDSELVTKDDKPQADSMDFFRFLRKEQKVSFEGLRVLDLGCGTGRNANYLAAEGASVVGFEISGTALSLAKDRARAMRLSTQFFKQNIGAKFPLADASQGVLLDIMSSSSLTEAEREVFVAECVRVLRPGGWFYIRTLCKDGDDNAKYLLKNNPGKEKDTYIMPGMNLAERVFSKPDFEALWKAYFEIIKLDKKTNYPRMNGRNYKRNYWLAYLRRKSD